MDMRGLWFILCGMIAVKCAANMVVNIVPGKTDYEFVPSKAVFTGSFPMPNPKFRSANSTWCSSVSVTVCC